MRPAVRRPAEQKRSFPRLAQNDAKRLRHIGGDVGLDLDLVAGCPVVALSPVFNPVRAAHQLGVDTHHLR